MVVAGRRWAGLPAAALLLFVVWAASVSATKLIWPGSDDTFITFIYARNLASGHGLVYNATEGKPTEGFSSTLHVLLLSLADKAGLDLLVASRGLAILAFVLIPVLIATGVAAACRVPLSLALAAALTLHLGYLFSPATSLHLNSGMETTLFMAVAAGLASWTLAEFRPPREPGKLRPVALVAGAAALSLTLIARPEGAFLAAGALAVLALGRGGGCRRPAFLRDRTLVAASALFVTFLALFLAWKQWYFGYLLPNPYYVKSSHAVMGSTRHFLPGLAHTTAFARACGPAAAGTAALLLLFRAVRVQWQLLAAVAAPGLITVALYARFIHEVAFGHRYEYPLLVYLQVALTAGAVLAFRGSARGNLLSAGLPALVVLARLGPLNFPDMDVLLWTRQTVDTTGSSVGIWPGKDLERTGLGPQASILTSAAGEIPFRSRFRAIDSIGLNTNALSGRTPLTVREAWEFIEARRPDVVLSALPPASPTGGFSGNDPVLNALAVRRALRGSGSELAKFRDKEKQREFVLNEMRHLRDHYQLGAAYPLGKRPPSWLLLYVRKDSPFRDRILATLRASARADHDSDLSPYFGNDPRRL